MINYRDCWKKTYILIRLRTAKMHTKFERIGIKCKELVGSRNLPEIRKDTRNTGSFSKNRKWYTRFCLQFFSRFHISQIHNKKAVTYVTKVLRQIL